MISIFPRIIKIIKAILVKIFKSKKLRLPIPYKLDVTVLVSVNIDNLNEFSKVKLSKVKILDRINIAIIKEIKTKKAIFDSSSSIFVSEINKFRLKIFFGFTNL